MNSVSLGTSFSLSIIRRQTTVKLTNENCFDVLKRLDSNSIDLVLIDPPYEVSRDTNFQSGEAEMEEM